MAIKTREELIKKYIDFFKKNGHKEIPSSSLVVSNDPTVLFTTAGMHPLVPYLLGQPHPMGKRLVDVQKCIRTGDIDEVGDEIHHTFFEMLGNWSLGDYFKEEAIKMTFEFHTKVLGIPIEKYAVSVFAGNKNSPKDEESAKIWKSLGIKEERIAYLEDNWWGPAGSTGPCGPDTEQFYYSGEKAPKKFDPNDKKWVEIGNDVIMQYVKDEKGNFNLAKRKNIDFGGGVERTLAVLNNFEDNYLTTIWQPLIKEIEKISGKKYGAVEKETKHMRIIADHLKASVFITADGVIPSNVERGYVLRRLIRRAIRYGKTLGLKNFTRKICIKVLEIYNDYDELKNNQQKILEEIEKEEIKFNLTLEEGLRIAKNLFDKKIPLNPKKANSLRNISSKKMEEIMDEILEKKKNGKNYSIEEYNISQKEIDNSLIMAKEAFDLYQSYGFPLDMIISLAIENNLLIDTKGFHEELKKHQELSRTASAGTFKSGLADNSERTTKLHTATHLLNEALREVLKDKTIRQKGSNINSERLRFDFNFPRKLTDQELKQVEDWINDKIKRKIPVKREELALSEALKSGAQGEFGAKYPERVCVYTIGDSKSTISKEICTGPHVEKTEDLGKFKILKEESSSAGIRRIKATVE